MPSIIYVHCTGVREPGFGQIFKVDEKAISRNLPGWNPVGCYWAKEGGVLLLRGGRFIPNYEDTRAIGERRGGRVDLHPPKEKRGRKLMR